MKKAVKNGGRRPAKKQKVESGLPIEGRREMRTKISAPDGGRIFDRPFARMCCKKRIPSAVEKIPAVHVKVVERIVCNKKRRQHEADNRPYRRPTHHIQTEGHRFHGWTFSRLRDPARSHLARWKHNSKVARPATGHPIGMRDASRNVRFLEVSRPLSAAKAPRSRHVRANPRWFSRRARGSP